MAIKSIFIGISIAAIPGPIYFELIRRTLTSGYRAGLTLLAGEYLGNFIVLSATYYGFVYFFNYEILRVVLYFLGGLLLIALGIRAIKARTKPLDTYVNKNKFNHGPFWVGLIISMTSPIVLALWVSLSGSYLILFEDRYFALVQIILICSGFLIFYLPMVLLIHLGQKIIPPNAIRIFSKVFGIVLILYGISFLYDVLNLTLF